MTGDIRRAGSIQPTDRSSRICKRDPASSVSLSRSRRSDQSGRFVPDPEVLALAGFVVTVILLLILAASIRVVHEGEFMVVFRLGRARGVVGAGLAVIIPLTDRGVRVAVPVGMVDLGLAGGRSRAQRGSPSQEIQGYPGLEMRRSVSGPRCWRDRAVPRRAEPQRSNSRRSCANSHGSRGQGLCRPARTLLKNGGPAGAFTGLASRSSKTTGRAEETLGGSFPRP